MGKRIAILTDFSLKGSGYFGIMSNAAIALHNAGHDVKIIGLEYQGEEHTFPFSVIPCPSFRDAETMIRNLEVLWKQDLLIVGMDIPIQMNMLAHLGGRSYSYLAVTPIENPPLCLDWAIALFPANGIFCISQIGTDAMKEMGLVAEHLVVGISPEWKPLSIEEKKEARSLLGYSPETFIVMYNADNQERKNLAAAFKTIKLLKQGTDMKLKFLLVTREHNPYGNRLRNLASDYGIENELVIYERGITQEHLRMLYNIADVYLHTSKAEGLGLPVLEAMACGTPVVATHTGAMIELLADGRGITVQPEYTIEHDVWGNSRRDFISVEGAANAIVAVANGDGVEEMVVKAREYIVNRSLAKMSEQFVQKVEELCK